MKFIAVAATALVASGCAVQNVQDLPLPGAIRGANTYAVTAIFSDATNLVPNETCRSNDVVIGSVSSVSLGKDLKAHVECRIKDSVALPNNVVATLGETSLLGERYVALDPPAGILPSGRLPHGTTIGEASNHVSPDVEVVLGALSQILNGGSIGKVATITDELTTILHNIDVPGTLRSLNRFVGSVADNRNLVGHSLDSLNAFARGLAAQRTAIARAIDAIPGGLRVLNAERPDFVRALAAVDALSRRAVPLIGQIRKATVSDIRHLAPVVQQLNISGQDLSLALERLTTWPFSSNTMALIRGDFGGAMINLNLNVDALNELLSPPQSTTNSSAHTTTATTATPSPLAPLLNLLGGQTLNLNGLLSGLTSSRASR